MAFTTYQTGKLFLIGTKPEGKLSVFERTFERCMGLCSTADAQTLWMSPIYQLWRFENALAPGQRTPDGYDRLYVPQLGYTTGDVDMHDIALGADGNPIFVNTLFSCLALRDGVPGFVTAVSTSDVHDGFIRSCRILLRRQFSRGWQSMK